MRKSVLSNVDIAEAAVLLSSAGGVPVVCGGREVYSLTDMRWSIDFMWVTPRTRSRSGRRIRPLTMIDDMTRECVGIFVDYSKPPGYVMAMPDCAASERGYLEFPRLGNALEFTGNDFKEWVDDHGVTLCHDGPDAPTDNAHIENFNGRFRWGCLGRRQFSMLGEGDEIVDAWRHHYNIGRPRGGSKYPAELAACSKETEPAGSPNTGTKKGASKTAAKGVFKSRMKGSLKAGAKGSEKVKRPRDPETAQERNTFRFGMRLKCGTDHGGATSRQACSGVISCR